MLPVDDLSNWLKSLPNKLTLGRVAAIPLLLIFFPFQARFTDWLSAILFGAAALTDFLDGYIARRYGTTTRLGALLDPVADKLLVTAALVILTASGRIPAFVVVILLSRDIAINGLRMVAAEQKLDIAVSQLGKMKTAVLDLSLFCLLANYASMPTIGLVSLWVAVGLSLFSGYVYAHEFWTAGGMNETKSGDEA